VEKITDLPLILVSRDWIGHYQAIVEREYDYDSYIGRGFTAVDALTDLLEKDFRKEFFVKVED
jgi:hypothetical protein